MGIQAVLRTIGAGLLLALLGEAAGVQAGEPVPDLDVFIRAGCPHCDSAKRFLETLRQEQPWLRIAVYDVAEDSAARTRLADAASERGVAHVGVPAFLVGTELIVGFLSDDTTGQEIRMQLNRRATGAPAAPAIGGIPTRWFGELRIADLGLPLFTVAVGLLDGFNPCAMWVLLFLLSLLVNLHDRAKMTLIAGTFVAVSGLLYFAFMAAWLNVFLLIGLSRPVQVGLGGIALIVGAINLQDVFVRQPGISLSIPASAKPGLYARVRRILQAESLAGAVAGIVVLAGLVNMIELLCTAGFPALYVQILTLQGLPKWTYYGHLVLYNLAYMFDDSLMVAIAVITLGRRKLQERAGRWLKLTSGLVMAGLGAVLLVRPQWLA